MIWKYLATAFATLIFITASDPFFGIELTLKPIPQEDSDDVRELPWMSTDAFRPYLEDHDERVSDLFKVSPYYYPNVNFWFLIYTQFESSHVVIHDKSNLSLIYKVLDFSSLHTEDMSRNVIYVLQQKLSEEKLKNLKEDLKFLAHNPFSLEPRAKNIYRILKHAGVQLPIKKLERAAFFNKLRDNVRTQTGQRNFIKDGIVRSLPYQPFITSYFKEKKLPRELLAIPFLESSFNPRAESRVGALGVWQFMPLISSYFVPKRTKFYDYRFNVGVASVAAGFLMQQNFRIMKSWDLAVTAYNSGTKHLLKTKRELASNDVDLEAIIKNSDSEHFGFASKNFYSEFLALVHTLAYEEELFEDIHSEDRYNVGENLRFYLTKCTLRFDRVLDKKQLDDVVYHNHHVKTLKRSYPRGFIITSKEKLPASKFFELKSETILKFMPKDWIRFLRRQSCSTR